MKSHYLGLLALISTVLNAQSPQREFRAAWIATVFNIDWPSRSGLEAETQKKELINMLDTLAELKFNAVIVQVKPSSDAFYQSKLSPWSRYLTGTQGSHPGYDPLAFLIEESRKRCLEVHAWVNPFRLSSGEKIENLAQSHIARKKPEWIIEYGGRFYLDPGNPAVRARVQEEVLEIVRNYDIDALHMDDYFYPYRIGNTPFGDGESYKKHGQNMALGDWRRKNTEDFVQNLAQSIKKEKSHVQFGISPFGVWRNESADPKGSKSKAGQTNYDDLFADILSWVDKGYVDYLIPQLYWEFNNASAPFGILADWWSKAVGGKTKLYLGLGVYRLGEGWEPSALAAQSEYLRRDTNISGAALYSAKWIHNNTKGVKNTLAGLFSSPALVPSYKDDAPSAPEITLKDGALHWKSVPGAWNYAVYSVQKEGEELLEAVLPGDLSYPAKEGLSYRVSSLSRSHAESPRASLGYIEKRSEKPALKPLPPKKTEPVLSPALPQTESPAPPRAEKPVPPAMKKSTEAVRPKKPSPPLEAVKPPAPESETPEKEPRPAKPIRPEKPLPPGQNEDKSQEDEALDEIFQLLEERSRIGAEAGEE